MSDLGMWMKSCGCSRPAIHWSSDFNARICDSCGTIIMPDSGNLEDDKSIPFVHLRVHTHLSLLRAICKTEDIISKAKEYGMGVASKTEYGNMFGVPTFIKDCVDAEVKPIIGVEFDTIFGDHRNPITYIALNHAGYKSLVKMTTTAWCKRKQKGDPFILIEDIVGDGVVALINLGNTPPQIAEYKLSHLMNVVETQLEVSYHGVETEKTAIGLAQELSKKYVLPIVATNDVHYTNKHDFGVFEVAMKIGRRDNIFLNSEYYFKSTEEMASTGLYLEWLENSVKIADRVEDYKIINKDFIVPTFKNKHGEWTIEQAHPKLEMDAWSGLAAKGLLNNKTYVDRLQYELGVMKEKKFSSYFLIISDIIDYIKRSKKLPPIGRGSSVGSLVCYCLDITAKDPIEWGVPFERFINYGRVDLPDIDTDITQEGRSDVLRYIADTHGHDRVAQIATFQTMALKASIDNVGRVLGVPHVQNIDIRNKIPDEITTMEEVPGNIKHSMSNVPGWVDYAMALNGIAKNSGYHAAGVVIANRPLTDLVPLMPEDEGLHGIQYDMKDIEILGLLKLDMLGLKTLDIIDNSLKRIKNKYNVNIDIYNLTSNDETSYKLISSGNYVSLFQLDSPGYRKLCRQLQPQNFDHVMALNALYRPGPLEGGMTDEYVERRHGKQDLIGWHPWLDGVLARTYQVPVFQEQVMDTAKIIAGFDDVEADKYRKAIGKKDKEKFDAAQKKFKERALKREGLTPPTNFHGSLENWIDDLLKRLAGYARYGWNLGHSLGYGWITYITAYLESHYPNEYYASLLDSTTNPTRKTSLIRGILHKKVRIVPPHINNSGSNFEAADDGAIYMGLSAVRTCGKAADEILENRAKCGRFNSFIDFCQRLPSINKTIKTNLVKAGAFSWDKMLTDRNKIDNIEILHKTIKKKNKTFDGSKIPSVQLLFGCFVDGIEFTDIQKQNNEREVLNSFITGHPAAIYQRLYPHFEKGNTRVICPSALQECEEGESVLLIGMVDSIRKKATVNGRNPGTPYLSISVSDNESAIITNIWSPLCNELESILTENQIAMIEGTTRRDKFKENFMSINISAAVMLINGVPIQGVFSSIEEDPTKLVTAIGGVVENITTMSDKKYASVRGGVVAVMPNILEDIVSSYPEARFLLHMG